MQLSRRQLSTLAFCLIAIAIGQSLVFAGALYQLHPAYASIFSGCVFVILLATMLITGRR